MEQVVKAFLELHKINIYFQNKTVKLTGEGVHNALL